jgi:hypothetical protein
LKDTIFLFIAYLDVPFIIGFKEQTFTFVTIFEYPYPITVFCYQAVFEVYYDTIDRFKIFYLRPEKLIENVVRKLGTILMNLMTAPDCLPQLDGTCFGSRIGTAINLIFKP